MQFVIAGEANFVVFENKFERKAETLVVAIVLVIS